MLLSWGIDYITATAKLYTEADAALQAVYDAIRFDEMAKGYDEKASRALGTSGTQIHTMYLGSHPEYRMLRVSGEWANVASEMLAMMGGRPNVTRIDAQVTVGYTHDNANRATQEAERIRHWQKESGLRNPPKVRLLQTFGQGDTCTLGARSSEVYIRLYDKSREQALVGPPWYWRYEVELKGQRANQAFEYFATTTDQPNAARTIVEAYAKPRGINIPWEHATTWEPAELPRPDTDDERALDWLKTQVRPTAVRLKRKLGLSVVQQALWLDSDTGDE